MMGSDKSENDKPSRWSVCGWSDLMEVSDGMKSEEEDNRVKQTNASVDTAAS